MWDHLLTLLNGTGGLYDLVLVLKMRDLAPAQPKIRDLAPAQQKNLGGRGGKPQALPARPPPASSMWDHLLTLLNGTGGFGSLSSFSIPPPTSRRA